MTVNSPAEYSSAYQKVVFKLSGLSLDADGCVEVDILVDERIEAVGTKRYYNRQMVEVDVSAYARAELDVVPVLHRGLAMIRSRSVPMSVRVGGDRSEKVQVTAGTHPLPYDTLLSDLQQRTIGLDERDEISFVTEQREVLPLITVIDREGNSQTWTDAPFLADKAVLVYGIDIANIVSQAQNYGIAPQAIRTIKIDMMIGAERYEMVKYDVRDQSDGVRLAWVNRFGAIDYYTFRNAISSQLVIQTDVPIGEPKPTYTECELASDVVPRRVAEALAGIVAASKVWVVDTDGYRLCEVISDSVEWDNCSKPSAIKLKIRIPNSLPSNER